jgi:hypothetical protein
MAGSAVLEEQLKRDAQLSTGYYVLVGLSDQPSDAD